ncbi:uncharacterized protein I206_103102 [Kwoniella pini CBS 10737]|uniref:Tetratricopeptide SHNi-TPR domain-containing protein n=1 Tax=Kwoniella pini CBS 10737 TaxID=1296096 RepID=A0A1B9IB26_9TREE|nr:uncharacterized protein I206_01894 [Kwoniella pini CBS 10737]OCF52601.1 hypothetical protein I206_01894 [Kwoniella pini CBS 10737]
MVELRFGSTDENPPQSASTGTEESSVPTDPKEIKEQADTLVAEGKKAIALKQWEEGVNKYGEALDLMRQLVGEFDAAMAPLLLSYGKALYELAFSQQGVMGKEEPTKEADDATVQGGSEDAKTGKFVFSDDEVQPEEENEAGPSNSNQPPEGDDGDEEEEPEDDYNAAWEVLDVARTIYQKITEGKNDDEAKEDKLNLADCYLALGDVSCETENFPQAVQDYTSALSLQSILLPSSSRILASTHYQLATVLEFTPNKRQEALQYVEKSLSGFKERLTQLKGNGEISEEVKGLNEKEKEKEKEIKDVESLIGDLEVKIEELKSTPQENDLISESINHLLGQNQFGSTNTTTSNKLKEEEESKPVNDLTSMVKKKKPKTIKPQQSEIGVQQVTEQVQSGVKQLIEDATEQSQAILNDANKALENGKAKFEQITGVSIQNVGEGLKRDNENEENPEERSSKKAKTE